MNKGYRDSKNSIYKYIFTYTILWAFFTPSWRFKNKNVTMWQCDNEPSHHHPLHTLQRTMQRATNQSFTLFAIVTSSCSTPVHLLHFTVVNGASTPFFYPPFSRKKLEKREEIPKKMRNFVGSFDCIDKAKICPAAAIWTVKTTIYPRFQRPRSPCPQQGENQAKQSITIWHITI